MDDKELRLICLQMVLGESAVPSDLTAAFAQAAQIYDFINGISVDNSVAPADAPIDAVAQPATE